MKIIAKFIIALALMTLIMSVSIGIGHFTFGYERVYSFIGGIAIGYECYHIADWLIYIITKRD